MALIHASLCLVAAGGSGAYVKKIFTITSGNYGQTFNYSVGAAGAGGTVNSGGSGGSSTSSQGTFSTTFALTASGGSGGVTIF